MINTIISRSQHFDHKDKQNIKNNGVVFTNTNTCLSIINLLKPLITDKICEPSVGKGAFIFQLLEYFKNKYSISELEYFVENNLYCYDINLDFIKELKNLLEEYFNKSLILKNILCQDFLTTNENFDIILGNPPYVRIQNMDKDKLELLKEELYSLRLGNVDLYYAFVEKSLLLSKKIGFIIPNSFIKNSSGQFLRDLILPRLNYIFDNGIDKVWSNISTYTCILICGEKTNKYHYQTKNIDTFIDKNEGFNYHKNEGNNNILSLLNYYNCGLATLNDNIYKITHHDGDYCYIGNYLIEKDICVKYLKATKNQYGYVIYPYKGNKIIDENKLKNLYPLCYKYLLDKKEILNLRDKGKTEKYEKWYAYGRKQGILKETVNKRIVLPLVFLRNKGLNITEIDNNDLLVFSGIMLDIPENNYDKVISILKSDNFYDYCLHNNKCLTDKNPDNIWLSITTSTFKNFYF